MKFKKLLVFFSFSLIFTLASIFASGAFAGNLTNGGFEDGNFNGWTLGTVSDSAEVVTADGYGTPNAGTYMARLGTPRSNDQERQPPGDNTIYQDFVASDSTLSFDYNIFTYDYAPFNHFHYTLTDLDSNAVITSYSQTAWDAGTALKSTGWQTVSLDITSYLGKNLRLEVSVAGSNDQFYATWVYVDSADSGPTTTATLSGTLGNNGWYKSDVTITLNATDDDSGVQTTEYSFDEITWNLYSEPIVVSTEGEQTIYYRSTDNEGNVESTKSQSYKIDKTAPVISIENPQDLFSYLLNQTVLASWQVQDAVSDVSSVVATKQNGESIDTGSVGEKDFNVCAQDFAGNENCGTSIYYVTYSFCGFSQPVNTDGSSIFKLGKTVPVKFCLKDANGNVVANATAKIFLSKISDSVSGSEIEGTSTSAATTGNLFRFDQTDQQYIFNLATNDLTKGTWRIIVDLGDGSSRSVNISLN